MMKMEVSKQDLLWLVSVAIHGIRLNELRERDLRVKEGMYDGKTPSSDTYLEECLDICTKYGLEQNFLNIYKRWTYND